MHMVFFLEKALQNGLRLPSDSLGDFFFLILPRPSIRLGALLLETHG